MTINVEWNPCPGCGYPIIERDGLRVEANWTLRLGEGTIDEDVEHECRER